MTRVWKGSALQRLMRHCGRLSKIVFRGIVSSLSLWNRRYAMMKLPSSDLDHLNMDVETESIYSYNDYTAFTDDFNSYNPQHTHIECQDDSGHVNSNDNGFYGNQTRFNEVFNDDTIQLPTNSLGSNFQETSESSDNSFNNSLDHSHQLEISFKENFILTNSFDCFKQSPTDSFHFNGRIETVSNIFQNFENENNKFHREWMNKLVNEKSLLRTIDSDAPLIGTDKILWAKLDNSEHHEHDLDKSSVRSVESLPITYIH